MQWRGDRHCAESAFLLQAERAKNREPRRKMGWVPKDRRQKEKERETFFILYPSTVAEKHCKY